MERHRRLRDPINFSRNHLQTIVPLRLFNITSLILGVLTIVYSILCYVFLGQNSEYVNTCSTEFDPNLGSKSPCDNYYDWNVYLVAALLTAFIQIFVTLTSLFCQWAGSKTNVWCATHSLILVALSPVFFFSFSSSHQPRDKNLEVFETLLTVGQQKIFVALVGLNTSFSLVAVILVSLFYGLELPAGYSRLSSADSSFA